MPQSLSTLAFMPTPHLQLLLAAVAGWVNRSQQDVIDYLRVENQVLREHTGGGRLRFTDAQRLRMAAAAKRVAIGRVLAHNEHGLSQKISTPSR